MAHSESQQMIVIIFTLSEKGFYLELNGNI